MLVAIVSKDTEQTQIYVKILVLGEAMFLIISFR